MHDGGCAAVGRAASPSSAGASPRETRTGRPLPVALVIRWRAARQRLDA
uniref:DMSO reductase regulatory protein DorY n=1 Tax=Cereibacter sphaeroides TaxID=1063 RepID=O86079_CERSP|nr:DMSO reductase regulatory protein DorY [Cereibacter sphaeroides]